jgi:hypothetical protein
MRCSRPISLINVELVSNNSTLIKLIAHENVIVCCHRENVKSLILIFYLFLIFLFCNYLYVATFL